MFAKQVKIDYTGKTLDGDYAEVRTVVVRPNDRLPFNYRLINEVGSWKVYDVVIEGVSLISNYRSQFSRIITGLKPNQFPRSYQWSYRLTIRKFNGGFIEGYHEKTDPS